MALLNIVLQSSFGRPRWTRASSSLAAAAV